MSARAYAPPTSRMLLVENVAMAAFYYGLGRLALVLAIPPGYAKRHLAAGRPRTSRDAGFPVSRLAGNLCRPLPG